MGHMDQSDTDQTVLPPLSIKGKNGNGSELPSVDVLYSGHEALAHV